jgi:hypothetical protein
VQCLNECQTTVRRAREDPKNQEVLQKLAHRAKMAQEQKQLLSHAVTDKDDLGRVEILQGKRQRKGVDRY